MLARLDVLQTFPFNRKAKPQSKPKEQMRSELEKLFISSLWDDYFEIMKAKSDEPKAEEQAKKTPRKNWDVKYVKKEMPIPKGALLEVLKVLINPNLE